MDCRARGRRSASSKGKKYESVHASIRWIAANWLRKAAMVVVLTATAITGGAFAASYIYDANGRLIVVTNDTGESARYHYDALGNIAEIERLSAGQLAIFAFSPGRGAPGVQVRIEGQGFSPTPSQNSVLFNGTPASVVSATPFVISAIVPTGATTGPVAVTVGTETAQSLQSFVVDENAGPPLIASINPLVATIGTMVAVDGQRLAPIAGQSVVRLNGRHVPPSTMIDTQIAFPVPPGVGSGRVSVATAFGTDTSSQDVLVMPADHASVEVSQVTRLVVGDPVESFSVSTGNQYVAVLFDGLAGEYLSLQFSSMSSSSTSVRLYGVDNSVLATPTVLPSSLTAHLPRLPSTGTYLLLIKPNTGPASWGMAIERAVEVNTDHEAAPVSIATPGQSKRLVFNAGASRGLGVGASNLVMSAGTYVTLSVYGPTGAALATTPCYGYNTQCDLNLQNLVPGWHTLLVSPASAGQTTSLDVTLSTERRAELLRDQVQTLVLDRIGQNGRLHFFASAGERLELHIQGQTTLPAGHEIYYRVYKPDGSLLASRSAVGPASFFLDNIHASGAYDIVVDPSFGALAELSLKLTEPMSGTLVIDGESAIVETFLPGQTSELKFEAVAGTNLGLGITSVFVSSTGNRYIYGGVYSPSGHQVAGIGGGCWAVTGCDLNFAVAETGEHVVRLYTIGEIMRFTATLSTDISESLVRGVKEGLHIARPGQNGRLTFSALTGETLFVQIAGGGYIDAYYRIYRPDGLLLTSVRTTSVATIELDNLPMTGDYLIFVDPVNGRTMTTFLTVDDEISVEIEPNDGSVSYSPGAPGSGIHFTFSAQAGQNLGLGIGQLQLSDMQSGYFANVTVISDDGSYIAGKTCYGNHGGCDFNFNGMNSGIYHVFVSPGNTDVLSFNVTLSSDMAAALLANVSQTVDIQREGQNARLSFDAVAGQSIALRITSQVTSHPDGMIGYRLRDSDGDLILQESVQEGRTFYLIDPPPLVSGTYELEVDPNYGATAQFQIILVDDISLHANGPSRSFSSAGRGDIGMYEFMIGAGERLTLDISSIVTSGTSNAARLRVYRPDSSWSSKQCTASTTECSYDLSSFDSGVHRLEVEPPTAGAGTVSFSATLSDEAQGSLQENVPQVVSVSRMGQSARYEFEAVAGASMTIVVSDIQTVPSGRTLKFTVRNPNGSIYRGPVSSSTSTTINLPDPPTTGTYFLDVDLPSGSTAQFRVEANTGGALSNGGSAVPFVSSLAWERSYLSFTMTSTGNRKLRTNQLSTPGTGNPARVEVHRPNGTSTFQNCTAGTATCTITLNSLAPGNYGVVVHPPADGDGTMSFNQTLATQ